MSTEKTFTVSQAAAGTRLDRFLAQCIGSRSLAQKLIAAGDVRIEGVSGPLKNCLLLAGGQEVIITQESENEKHVVAYVAPGQRGFEVVFEDDDLLIIDKEAGLVVHPGPGHYEHTLVQQLCGKADGGADPQRPGIVHRIDKETSGLLVVAKNDATHRALQQALAKREVTRQYTALVVGVPDAKEGFIDAAIGPDLKQPTRMALQSRSLKPAQTEFVVKQVFRRSALLQLRLHTGRTHQIRVHLAAIGTPICGDQTYGKPDIYGLKRQFLHAHQLSFSHPQTQQKMSWTSRLPADLQQALARAETE